MLSVRFWLQSLAGRLVLSSVLLCRTGWADESAKQAVKTTSSQTEASQPQVEADLETKKSCAEAYERTQRLRRDAQLTSARAAALVCSQPQCPEILSQDCASWLSEIDRALPTVAFQLETADGTPVSDFRISIDDGPFVPADGRARPLDPGRHTVALRSADGRKVVETFTAVEGRKGTLVVGQLPPAVPEETSRTGLARVPTATWVLAGVGVAGLAGFAGFAVDGKSKEDALASCSPNCPPEAGDPARTSYLVADISLGVGIAALGGAAAFWILSPREPVDRASGPGTRESIQSSRTPRLRMELAPRLGGASLAFSGWF